MYFRFKSRGLRFLLLPSLVLYSFYCSAQFNERNKELPIPVFREVNYPLLPTITSRGIYFSQDSLMWFSTANGLASFDGTSVLHHSTGQLANDLNLIKIDAFAEDKDHNLFLGTRNGLIFYDRSLHSFSPLLYDFNKLKREDMLGPFTIFIDDEGIVYGGIISRGFVIYNPHTKKWIHLNLDPSKDDRWENRIQNTVVSISPHFSDRSKLWLGTYNGIFLFDKATRKLSRNFTVINPLVGHTGGVREFYDVQRMEVISDSIIWFNTWGSGLCEYNINTGIATAYLQRDAAVTGNDRRTIGSSGFIKLSENFFFVGVLTWNSTLFNHKTKKVYPIDRFENEKILDWVTFVTKDRNDNIWLIRNSKLYNSIPIYSRINATDISRQLTPDNIGNELRGIYYDSISYKYYGAVRHSSGVYVFDTSFNLIEIIPTPLFTNRYTYKETCTDKITRDGSGRFWTAGHEVYIKLPTSKKFDYIRNIAPGLKWIDKKGEFEALTTTPEGDILISNRSYTYLINHNTLHTDTLHLPGFEYSGSYGVSAPSLILDAFNSIVYLTNSKGIAQYNMRTKKIISLSEKVFAGHDPQGFPDIKIALEDSGRIWAMQTNGSIRIIDPVSLLCIDSLIPGSRGLKQDSYFNISNAGENMMALQGQSGVVIYNYRKQQSLLFDKSNGLIYPTLVSMQHYNGHLIIGQISKVLFYKTAFFDHNNFALQPRVNLILSDTEIVYRRETNNTQNKILLKHNQNNLKISFSAPEFIFPERIEYAYQLSGFEKEWQYANFFKREVSYTRLPPGEYIFKLKAQMQGGNWETLPAEYVIVISPAWWQTSLFKISSLLLLIGSIVLIFQLRIRSIRRREERKIIHEKELLELEAKALRAQMNPHFIFNCLNSIKALIKEDDKQKATDYLTTFSKLIRTLFQNSDKRQISLFDEVETCRLYTQLEAMRLKGKLNYNFIIDPNVDLKSVMVPALIIQPFIENAIWHGIVPKEEGTINVSITQNEDAIVCEVDDDGIGRELSMLNKPVTPVIHESKGVHLSQARIDLEKKLNESQASIKIIDKYENDKAKGTRVVITFDLN